MAEPPLLAYVLYGCPLSLQQFVKWHNSRCTVQVTNRVCAHLDFEGTILVNMARKENIFCLNMNLEKNVEFGKNDLINEIKNYTKM